MSSSNLPPLGVLRAFYFAARHESVVKAADEINVSASAVSQSIKKLEEWYEVPLLKREKNQITLTASGSILKNACESIFQTLEDATKEISKTSENRSVILSILPSFVSLKLNQLVLKLSEVHPDVSIRINSNSTLTDFRYDDVDIAIRYAINPSSKYHKTIKICEDKISPCISRSLLGNDDANDPEILKKHKIIYDSSSGLESEDHWTCWLDAQNYSSHDINSESSITTDNFYHAVELASNGQGILMGRDFLLNEVKEELNLVQLFPACVPVSIESSYFILHRTESMLTPQALLVRDFLVNELCK